MSTPLFKKLLRKHSKPVDKQIPPIPIAAENLQKILPAVGLAARAAGPAIGRALGAGAKAAKPQLAQAGKTALDTAAVTAGTEVGHAASKKFNQKTGLDKQLPAIATQDTPTQRKQRLKNISAFNSKIMPMVDPTGGEGADAHAGVSEAMEGPASKVAVRKQSPDSPLTLLFEFLNKQKDFDKSAISDAPRTSHGSEKDKEQRKKDSKFWEEKNLEYLKNHPDKRGGR